VRFRNAGLVRALIVHALKDGLAREGRRTAANTDGSALVGVRPSFAPRPTKLGLAQFAGLYRSIQRLCSEALWQRALADEAGQAAFDVGTPTADVRFETQPQPTCSTARWARRGRRSRNLHRVADPAMA